MYNVSSPQAYDRAITVFSPEGRLYQVEYAKEAVKRGATAVSIITKDGITIIAYKNANSRLLVPESLKKIFEVDKHVATVASGLVGDARRLIDYARLEAQRYTITYDEPASVEHIAKELSDIMQFFTQYGGGRPFGVSLLVCGIDEVPKLYEVEPSGALTGYKATAIGFGKKEAEEILEKEYSDAFNIEQGINLGVKVIKSVLSSSEEQKAKKFSADMLEIAYATIQEKKFKYLDNEQITKYLK
ncbi:MAG: archaeal proteasome endopeptidase complex subunit alpha [Candidatus Anstonellales archaeon]